MHRTRSLYPGEAASVLVHGGDSVGDEYMNIKGRIKRSVDVAVFTYQYQTIIPIYKFSLYHFFMVMMSRW